MIPCIEEKCLKFPVCKNKKEVFCRSLYQYCTDLEEKKCNDIVWNLINMHLPKLNSIDQHESIYERIGMKP